MKIPKGAILVSDTTDPSWRHDWPRKPVLRALLLALALASAIAIVFRVPLAANFNSLFGDYWDGMIMRSILEHWFNVFRGRASWDTTNYFFPYTGTLGYNDAYLIYGVLYSLFRFGGLDAFISSEFVSLSIRIIGFLSFFAFALRIVRLPFLWSLFGAVLFTISNGAYLRMPLPQLLTVGFAPLMALLIGEAFNALQEEKKWPTILWGSAAGIFFSCWLLTAFYMAWFLAFFSLTFILVMLILQRFEPLQSVWRVIRRNVASLGIIAAASLISALPFLYLYLPKMAETAGHSFGETLFYSPSVLDIFHVGNENLVFGKLDELVHDWLRPNFPLYSEQITGMPLILLALWGIACFLALRRPFKNGEMLWITGLALTTIVTWLLSLHFGSWTAWYAVWSIFPGAKAIRAVARYQLFLVAPVIVVTLHYLANLRVTRARPILLLLCVLLIAEEINLRDLQHLRRWDELKLLNRFTAPPRDCRAFFALGKRPGQSPVASFDGAYNPNVEAMLLAEMFGIPTVNGFSSFVPPDWDFSYSDRPDYRSRVWRYSLVHGLKGLCALDISSSTWSSASMLNEAAFYSAVGNSYSTANGGDGIIFLNGGWHEPESWGVWSKGGVATLLMPLRQPADDPLILAVRATGLMKPQGHPQKISVSVNGIGVDIWQVGPESDFRALIPQAVTQGRFLLVQFDIGHPMTPREATGASDTRMLGFGLISFRLEPAGPVPRT